MVTVAVNHHVARSSGVTATGPSDRDLLGSRSSRFTRITADRTVAGANPIRSQ